MKTTVRVMRPGKARTWSRERRDATHMLYTLCWYYDDAKLQIGIMVRVDAEPWMVAKHLRIAREAMRLEIVKRQKVRQLGRDIIKRCVS